MNRLIGASVRRAARISGVLLVGLVVLIAIGEGGPPNILAQPLPVQIEFAAMFLMLVAFLVGWRWEAVGVVAAIAGFVLFLATELVVNGKPPGGNLQKAVRDRRILKFYLFQLCQEREAEDRYYVYDQRFMCKDCVSLFASLIPTDRA